MKKILPGILIPMIIMAAGVCTTTYNAGKKDLTTGNENKERKDSAGVIRLTTPSSASISVQSSFRSAVTHRQTVFLKV